MINTLLSLCKRKNNRTTILPCPQCFRHTVFVYFETSLNKLERGEWCDWCYDRVDDLR